MSPAPNPTCNTPKTLGQTLFLGASVVSVNVRLGWGGQASNASIELVEDFQPVSCYLNNVAIDQYRNTPTYADDHYYTCTGDDCFVNEYGVAYDSNANPPHAEKNVPGKIYYVWTTTGIKSRYWVSQDPGFFGTGTRVKPDGTLSNKAENIYNLIGIPVFFKFDKFKFVGIIKSWENNYRQGKNFYTVNLESMSNVLNSSYLIMDQYGGSVFSKDPAAPVANYGAPHNYIGDALSPIGTIKQGNIHNVFNVYGFLDSLGPYGYGGSNINDNGIPVRTAIDAVKILTSSEYITQLNWRKKRIFSPFGRILAKNMEKVSTLNDDGTISPLSDHTEPVQTAIQNYSFGIIPPVLDSNNVYRVPFCLDISSLRVPPDEIRIEASNGVMSITEFIDYIVSINGQQDYYLSTECIVRNSLPYNIIKINTVDKRTYVTPGAVRKTIADLQSAGYSVTSSMSGQEANSQAKVRTMYIGGKQQRLYQAKNYRLAYNQTNFVWDPFIGQFVNFRRLDSTAKDKIKYPLTLSTRNPAISVLVNGPIINAVWNNDEDLRSLLLGGQTFTTQDNNFNDSEILADDGTTCNIVYQIKDIAIDLNKGTYQGDVTIIGGTFVGSNTNNNLIIGNYEETLVTTTTSSSLRRSGKAKQNQTDTLTGPPVPPSPPDPTPTPSPTPSPSPPTPGVASQVNRYIPLYEDVVCPFFGYKLDQTFQISKDSNLHRYIRPVILDSWTGQLAVVFDINELPPLACGYMPSLYNPAVLGDGVTPVSIPVPAGGGLGSSTDTASPRQNSQPIPTTTASPSSTVLPNSRLDRINYPGFLVTETEFRAADSWETYLLYCLGKSAYTKPDLFCMLIAAYAARGMSIFLPPTKQQNITIPGGLGSTVGTASPTVNVAGTALPGQPTLPKDALNTWFSSINFSLYLIPQFISDLDAIVKFIKTIGDRYYGRQYMVKLPIMLSYQDQQYSSFEIPGFGTGNIFVFSGSGKLFHNYEKCEGAWEEHGNLIDNKIVVGGPYWKVLSNEEGLIPPILGYNASDRIDKVRKAWCLLTAQQKADEIMRIKNNIIASTSPQVPYRETVTSDMTSSNWTSPTTWKITLLIGDPPNQTQMDVDSTTDVTGLLKLQDILPITSAQIETARNAIAKIRAAIQVFDSMNAYVGCRVAQYQVPANTSTTSSATTNTYTVLYSDDSNFLIPSINTAMLSSSDYVVVPSEPIKDAWGVNVCAGGKKLYSRATFEDIAFGNPHNLTDPRAILVMPSPITLASTSYAYEKDPNLTIIANIAVEDLGFYANVQTPSSMTADQKMFFSYLQSWVHPIVPRSPVLAGGTPALVIWPDGKNNSSAYSHRTIQPKMAQPFFAAVPLRSNKACYGPWVNYPNLSRSTVFNHLTNPDTFIENQIGNVLVKQDSNLVPWKYGGMSFLDKAVTYKVDSDVNYQTVLEKGSVSIYGPPLFTMGGYFTSGTTNLTDPYTLVSTDINVYDYPTTESSNYSTDMCTFNVLELNPVVSSVFMGYPLIDNINMNIGNEGVTTNYTFATYSPKNGLYGKEYIEKISSLSKKYNSLSTKLTQSFNESVNNTNKKFQEIIDSFGSNKGRTAYDTTSLSKGLFGNSPTEIIMGQAAPYLPYIPEGKNVAPSSIIKAYRHETWAGMYMATELGADLYKGYNQKSYMTMDGLLSPISFYPTTKLATYSMSNIETAKSVATGVSGITGVICSVCHNDYKLSEEFIDYSSSTRTATTITFPCPACSRSKIKVVKTDKGKKNDPLDINFYTLNPVIISRGEFHNANSPKAFITGVNDTHSIRGVAHGESLPIITSLDTHKNAGYDKKDYIHPDYDALDFPSQAIDNNSRPYLLNQRFFGMRGPLMLHSWGYDTDGYPVPNLYDDVLEYDQWTRPKRFVLKSDGTNDLDKAGLFEPTTTDPRLGDIITKRYEWKNNKWVKKTNPSKYFAENWGAKPHIWNVGPIDLRWDNDRRVWTGGGGSCGPELLPPFILTNSSDSNTLNEYLETKRANKCPYKLIYITLEQDLVKQDNFDYSFPARGFIDDLEYKSDSLQRGYRRLVYILDRSGYTAPKGTKLYCKYNPDTGFYEPISKPTITAKGQITGTQARLEMHYVQGRRSGSIPTMAVSFDNPLGFQTPNNGIGMFTFINGKWTLTAIK